MLFATEKCVTGNRRPVARENELLPARWDGVNRGIGTEEPLQSSGETLTGHVKLYLGR